MFRRIATLLTFFTFIMPLQVMAQTGSPQQAAAKPKAAPSPRATVIIESSDFDSTEAQIVDEISRTLSDGKNFRVISMIGLGSVQNISDLLELRKVDAAVVQYDVLSQFKEKQRIPGIENKMQYITKLYSQEFHVLSRMQYTCLADLEGRRVNFGPQGSGGAMTAEIVFGAHQVKVQPLYMDQASAFEKLKAGEIDAMVYVGGKPAPAFKKLKYTDKVHFLDVDYADALQKDYLPAILTYDDYPDLVAPDETVTTVAVNSVLLMAGHKSNSEQYRQLSVFVDQFFSKFETLKAKPLHEKWREVNILAPVPGWQRFPAAQSWLDANADKIAKITAEQTLASSIRPLAAPEPAQLSPKNVRETLRKFVETEPGSGQTDREELFNQFVRWYEKQER